MSKFTIASYALPIKPKKDWLFGNIDIDKDGCWIWRGAKSSYGYGQYRRKGVTYYAHRKSLEISTGEILTSKDYACHKCDKPACIKPTCLFKGSHADNLRDAANKKRFPYGANHYKAKLTQAQVDEIRILYIKGGYTFTSLGKLFGVSRKTVSGIVYEQTWK